MSSVCATAMRVQEVGSFPMCEDYYFCPYYFSSFNQIFPCWGLSRTLAEL